MLTRIFLFLIGYVTVSVPEDGIRELTRLAFEAGIPLYIGRKRKYRIIRCRERDFSILCELVEKAGTELHSVRHSGLTVLFKNYKKRWGLFVGALIMLTVLLISDDFVWRIEIVGNGTVPRETIISELAELGFSEGVYHKNIDFDVLHNRFLARSRDVAWIAVNMHGSVAYVEVREYLPSEKNDTNDCANIIASCDGIITQVSAFEGNAAVSIGDEVKKGQLLVSGIISYEGTDTKYVHARGEVYAEVFKNVNVRVPLKREIKQETGEIDREYGLKIFSREIFFGGKGRIENPLCDTITMYKDVTLFGAVTLPIKVIITEHKPFVYKAETLSPDRAAALAYGEYKRAFIDATEGVTLLSYETSEGLSENGDEYVIDCVLRVITNIAETKEFTVE